VVVAAAERRSALLVDALVGQQQVVTRAMTGISRAPGVSGAAILGDGHVGLILDIAEINTLARSGTPA
jgi:two-component system chemotaxis sensor kinase CheA